MVDPTMNTSALLLSLTSLPASAASLSCAAQKEMELNAQLQRISQQPANAPGAAPAAAAAAQPGGAAAALAAQRALGELARWVFGFFREQQRALAMCMSMTAARRLHLHLGGPSTRLVNAFQQEQPWCGGGPVGGAC